MKEKTFVTSKYEYPICNHTDALTEHNEGYVKGITNEGVPFEAELYTNGDDVSLSFILPDVCVITYDKNKSPIKENNIVGFNREKECMDYSILDVGMVDEGMEENLAVTAQYVEWIEDMGLVYFETEVRNGTVFYRTDISGNEIVKIQITVNEGSRFWANSLLPFYEFQGQKKKPNLRLVKD